MRKLVRTILLTGLLCSLEFLRTEESFGNAPSKALASNSTAEQTMLDGRANHCANAMPILLAVVARSRNGHPPHKVTVSQLPDRHTFLFVSGMTIDADGAPNAYSPDDTGLDELANAGTAAHWNGIITDRDGNPLVQQESDPFPGYYISCTSLSDTSKRFTDPTAYVDASKIPYIALPKALADRGGARLGDLAFVMNLRNSKSSFAIYAEIGSLGEGSIALADTLGIWSDARQGGQSDGVLYVMFPRSGNLRPRTTEQIQSEGEELLYRMIRMKERYSCAETAVADEQF